MIKVGGVTVDMKGIDKFLQRAWTRPLHRTTKFCKHTLAGILGALFAPGILVLCWLVFELLDAGKWWVIVGALLTVWIGVFAFRLAEDLNDNR